MTFPSQVERWRDLVRSVLADEIGPTSPEKALLDRSGLTIDPQLVEIILAIIQKESYGDPDAIGDNGNSIGLMQLNYAAGTPQRVAFTGTPFDLQDPEENITRGSMYFLKQLQRYGGDVDKAIAAFNAGSYIQNAAGVPVNNPYVQAVLSFLSEKKTSSSSERLSYSSLYPRGGKSDVRRTRDLRA